METKQKKKLWCPQKSLVKLVLRDQHNRLLLPTYSLFHREKKYKYNLNAIVGDMKARLIDKEGTQNIKTAFFYDNQKKNCNNNEDLLLKIENGPQSAPKSTSKIKAIVYDLEGFSYQDESTPMDEQGTTLKEVIIERMLVRICKDQLKNRYRTANFYDIAKDELLTKHNPFKGYYK